LGGGGGGLISTGHLQMVQTVPAFCMLLQLGHSVMRIMAFLLLGAYYSKLRASHSKDLTRILPGMEIQPFCVFTGTVRYGQL
jgi:hypothetical protein